MTAAENAAEAMRALAHATRTFEDPADTYWTLGNILAITSRFIQVLEQVADAHRAQIDRAHDDDGRRTAGRAFGLSAATNLHQAALALGDGYRRLDEASRTSGRIAWYADVPARRTLVPRAVNDAKVVPLTGGGRPEPQPPYVEPGL
ncbi:hypothetical protein [Xylanimonas protaetiae]|uniref:hypothetical protein n=1 Tax=Xylanimonas protaetiae TaxID=2509457 RepID=UPI0013EA4BF8|nr:hypothetical protein [Xylanimonas protaetiae]